MKSRLILILIIAILCGACSDYITCPAYGTHYTYTPPKQKSVKMKSTRVKKVKQGKAEID